MAFAALFPGQGSQTVGMLADFEDSCPEIQPTFTEASDALGYDLWTLCQDGPAEQLSLTEITQPLLLTAGVALYRAWTAAGGASASFMAGHSLGEYTALTAAGSLPLADAVRSAEVAMGSRRRVLVRPSGTEPLFRVMVEADDARTVDSWTSRLAQMAETHLNAA